ncbi:2-phosphosulfolactate phosphatase [soil metagenome]
MHIRVDLLPSPPYDDVVILIDVLRTCTVAPILFENGLKRLHLATKLKLARNLAEETKWTLLGERKGLPPEGFNYGNSPAELRNVALHGAEAVLVSENAPLTMPLLNGAEHLLLGSLYNADAVVEHALKLAKKRIYLVCSGLWGREDLDDTLAAGFLAARLHYRNPAAELGGAARLAINLVQAFPDPLEAFWRSSSGQYLRSLNLLDDLAVASLVSQTEHVPTLAETRTYEQGTLYTFVSPL